MFLKLKKFREYDMIDGTIVYSSLLKNDIFRKKHHKQILFDNDGSEKIDARIFIKNTSIREDGL